MTPRDSSRKIGGGNVKQAEDVATLELPGLDVTQPKRGRGILKSGE